MTSEPSHASTSYPRERKYLASRPLPQPKSRIRPLFRKKENLFQTALMSALTVDEK